MTLERMLCIAAFLLLCGFLFVLVWKVPRLDIAVAIFATLVLCGYDLFVHRPDTRSLQK